jgi:hypothetical protein
MHFFLSFIQFNKAKNKVVRHSIEKVAVVY